MLTDKEDIELLMRAAAFTKIPADQLKPEQPWKFEGKTAELLQMATEAINPVKAAQWRSEAGGSISLATQAAELGLQPHTKATKILSDVYVMSNSRQERSAGKCQCSGTTEGERQADEALHQPTVSGGMMPSMLLVVTECRYPASGDQPTCLCQVGAQSLQPMSIWQGWSDQASSSTFSPAL